MFAYIIAAYLALMLRALTRTLSVRMARQGHPFVQPSIIQREDAPGVILPSTGHTNANHGKDGDVEHDGVGAASRQSWAGRTRLVLPPEVFNPPEGEGRVGATGPIHQGNMCVSYRGYTPTRRIYRLYDTSGSVHPCNSRNPDIEAYKGGLGRLSEV